MPNPIVLTDEDFADHEHIRGHDGFVLVLAHTNMLDEKTAAPDEPDWEQASGFLQMALRVAEEFPEVQVGLFNSRHYNFMARRLGVLSSFSTFECWAQVFLDGLSAHSTSSDYDEPPDAFRTWLLGILIEFEYRRPQSLDEAMIWLAYNLCEHPMISYDEARWNEEGMRGRAVKAVRDNFKRLQRQWQSVLEDDDTTDEPEANDPSS